MKRFPLPDLLKGFAVFLIVPVHILETFIDLPGRESLFGNILLMLGGPIAVPIFMMVMGYFIALNKKSTLQNVFRGVFIFILGILLNIGLNFHLLLKIYTEGWQFDPLQFIFGVDIFFLAGLSIIILALLKNIKKGLKWILLALILLISGSTSYLNDILPVTGRNYLLPFIAGKYAWSYFPLFPWLAYPLVGFLFQKSETQIRAQIESHKTSTIALLVSIIILVIIFSPFGMDITIHLHEYYHHGFLYFLWALGVVIIWVVLFWLIVQKFAQSSIILFIRWLGKNITVFYIIQWLIIGNIATAIFQTQDISRFVFWFVPIFLITAGLTWVIERIRSSKKIV